MAWMAIVSMPSVVQAQDSPSFVIFGWDIEAMILGGIGLPLTCDNASTAARQLNTSQIGPDGQFGQGVQMALPGWEESFPQAYIDAPVRLDDNGNPDPWQGWSWVELPTRGAAAPFVPDELKDPSWADPPADSQWVAGLWGNELPSATGPDGEIRWVTAFMGGWAIPTAEQARRMRVRMTYRAEDQLVAVYLNSLRDNKNLLVSPITRDTSSQGTEPGVVELSGFQEGINLLTFVVHSTKQPDEAQNYTGFAAAFDAHCFTPAVTVTKLLSPEGDAGRFTLGIEADGQSTQQPDLGHRQSVGPVQIEPGTLVSISEIAGTSTNLAEYNSALTCDGVSLAANTGVAGSFTMPETNVNCTFTNTHQEEPATITLTKIVVPAEDTGKFNLRVSAGGSTTEASELGNRGTTGAVQVAPGTPVTISELAASGTSLADYDSTLVCTGVDGVAGAVTSASFPMPSGAVNCSFTNIRKAAPATLTVLKALSPVDDPGRFTLQINGRATASSSNVGHGGSTGAVVIAPGTPVTISEIAGSATDLADYSSQLSCRGAVTGITGTTSGSFNMPGGPVVCTFTNTRKGAPPTVTVTKALSPASDPGRFILQVNGTPVASHVGDGGTASVLVSPGETVTVAELPGSGTRLADYNSYVMCTGVNGFVTTSPTSGRFTMPEGAVNCSFHNTRKPAAAPAPAPIPTLGEWALGVLGLLAAGLGALRLRRA